MNKVIQKENYIFASRSKAVQVYRKNRRSRRKEWTIGKRKRKQKKKEKKDTKDTDNGRKPKCISS